MKAARVHSPLLYRPAPPVKDPAYLAFIRGQPCALGHFGGSQYGFVEAAHVGPRGRGQKAHDRETIPLCAWHHRTGPHSYHNLGKRFARHYGLDLMDLVRQLQERYAREESQRLLANPEVA